MIHLFLDPNLPRSGPCPRPSASRTRTAPTGAGVGAEEAAEAAEGAAAAACRDNELGSLDPRLLTASDPNEAPIDPKKITLRSQRVRRCLCAVIFGVRILLHVQEHVFGSPQIHKGAWVYLPEASKTGRLFLQICPGTLFSCKNSLLGGCGFAFCPCHQGARSTTWKSDLHAGGRRKRSLTAKWI